MQRRGSDGLENIRLQEGVGSVTNCSEIGPETNKVAKQYIQCINKRPKSFIINVTTGNIELSHQFTMTAKGIHFTLTSPRLCYLILLHELLHIIFHTGQHRFNSRHPNLTTSVASGSSYSFLQA